MDKWLTNIFFIIPYLLFLMSVALINACTTHPTTSTEPYQDPNDIEPLPVSPQNSELEGKLLSSTQITQLTNQLKKQMLDQTDNNNELRRGQRAKKYSNAFYDVNWQNKIKRIANANYPKALLKNKLTSSVLIDIQINADGSLFNVVILRSSGSKILDNAAIKIINLASPFAPLTHEIISVTQIYHIIKNWHFINGALSF